MMMEENIRRFLSMFLVVMMLFALTLQASAEELPGDSVVPPEPTIQETETLPSQEVLPPETETTIPEEEDVPAETFPQEEITEKEDPEKEEQPEDTSFFGMPEPLTVARILALEPGTEDVLISGTVVFVLENRAVLQDETGGIWLSFEEIPEIRPGDILLAAGSRNDGFAVAEYTVTGTGELPSTEGTLDQSISGVRLSVKGAVLEEGGLSQNGSTYMLHGEVPETLAPGDLVDAWGVIFEDVFYADTLLASEAPPAPPEIRISDEWNFYFGLLHAHTADSDGTGSVAEAFSYAAAVENLDFFAVTDHSNSFDNGTQGAVNNDGSGISAIWAAGKAAAAAATDASFVGIYGYEMTWTEMDAVGHISTFNTPGWQTRDQAGMTLEGYLEALGSASGSVSQFNHPGPFYGDFNDFSGYDAVYDSRIHLLEVGGEGGFTAYPYYTKALDNGWHLAPSNNQNNHNGSWGSVNDSRTVVLARELTETAIYDAVRNYRVYATEDSDLQILFRLNSCLMGGTVGAGGTLTAGLSAADLSGEPLGLVEIITDGGKVAASRQISEAAANLDLNVAAGGSYYYLRLTQTDGDVAVTAPVWVESYEDLGIADLTADNGKPEAGTDAQLTLTIYNDERIPFLLESVTFSAGERTLHTVSEPGRVESAETRSFTVTHREAEAGSVTVTATVAGTIGGSRKTYQREIILQFQPPATQVVTVAQARAALPGEACRIQGYVTAGTAKPCNTFPGSIYLQDNTGGIQIVDFTDTGIQLGTPLEVEGILRRTGGNTVLAMTDYRILEEDFYRHVPKTTPHESAMDYDAHGGELLQIEGRVVSVTKNDDQKGVSRFTIVDICGDEATVLIEGNIGSGAYGTNDLASEVKLERTVRAMGLLHIDEYGQTVLRVRNCDEVVYVPPKKDPTNPRTGDWRAFLK